MNMSACVKSDSASRNPDRAVLIFVRASSLNSLDWSKIRDSSFRSGSKFPSDVPDSSKFSPNISTFFSDENVIFGSFLFFASNFSKSFRRFFHSKFRQFSRQNLRWNSQQNSIQTLSKVSLVPVSLFIFFKNHKICQIFFHSKLLNISQQNFSL